MASCYDRVSCSVDPDTGALTINTKHGSCTVVPGDDVTFTETEVGYIITINGEPNIIPKIEPGDDVNFTETDDCFLITINNEPHCIPKCRYYRDCEGNILDDCERIVTCDDLESRGYIACFDANDFDITAEDVDGELTRCLHIAWDRICNAAETVAEIPDNANLLFCLNGEIGKGPIPTADFDITDCIEGTFANAGQACEVTQLVLSVDADGCQRIATYNQADASRSIFSSCGMYPQGPLQFVPADNADLTSYYFSGELADDVLAGTVDEAKLQATAIASVDFTVTCPGQRLRLFQQLSNQFDPLLNGGQGSTGQVFYRLDGEIPILPGNEGVQNFGNFTQYQAGSDHDTGLAGLAVGPHTLEIFVLRLQENAPMPQVTVTTPTRCVNNGRVSLDFG